MRAALYSPPGLGRIIMLVPFSFSPPAIHSEDFPPEPVYPKPLSAPQVQLCRQQVPQAEFKKQKRKDSLLLYHSLHKGGRWHVKQDLKKSLHSLTSPIFVCFCFCSFTAGKSLMHEMWFDGGDGGESAALINGSCMGC